MVVRSEAPVLPVRPARSVDDLVLHGADVEPPGPEIFDRLVADPLFAPLDVRALERLAAGAEPIAAAEF